MKKSNIINVSFNVNLNDVLFKFENNNHEGLTAKDFKEYFNNNPEELDNYITLLTKVAKHSTLIEADFCAADFNADATIRLFGNKLTNAIMKEKENIKPSIKKNKM